IGRMQNHFLSTLQFTTVCRTDTGEAGEVDNNGTCLPPAYDMAVVTHRLFSWDGVPSSTIGRLKKFETFESGVANLHAPNPTRDILHSFVWTGPAYYNMRARRVFKNMPGGPPPMPPQASTPIPPEGRTLKDYRNIAGGDPYDPIQNAAFQAVVKDMGDS